MPPKGFLLSKALLNHCVNTLRMSDKHHQSGMLTDASGFMFCFQKIREKKHKALHYNLVCLFKSYDC